MLEDPSGEAKVVRGVLQSIASGSIRGKCELRVHGSQVEEDVGELEPDVVLGVDMVGMVS